MVAHAAALEPSSRWAVSLQRSGPAIACAVAGFLSAFTVPIVGQMPVGELLLMTVFPWVLVRTYFRREWPARLQQLGWFRLLLLMMGTMAVGYVVSDLYRETRFDNLARGWARVGFLAIDLVAISYLIDRSWQRLRLFVIALYVGGTINALVSGPLYGEWWKFGFGYTTSALVLLALAGRAGGIQVAVAMLLGIVNLALGARSLGAICLLTGGLFGMNYTRGIWRTIAVLGSLGITVGLLFVANATIVDNQNHAGSNIERRSMIETAAEAFVSSPFIGQGSWFTSTDLIRRLEENRAAIDASFRGYTEEEARKLAIHSQLLVALAEGGILGGVFFLGLGGLILKTLRSLVYFSVPCRALVFYLVLNGGWNLLMSPFSGVARVEIALLICTCLLVVLQRQGELSEDFRE